MLMLVFVGMNSCLISGLKGEGKIVTKEIIVEPYSIVEHVSPARVEISFNDTNQVFLTDYQNLIDYWDIKTIGNSLKIKTIPYTSFTNSTAIIGVKKSDNLSRVILTGSGDMLIQNFFSSLNFYQLVGSGTIDQLEDVNLSSLSLKLTGSGDINISGKTDKLIADLTGSGNINLQNTVSRTADCNIDGTGDIFLQVTDTLKGSIKGTGSIQYSGSPVVLVRITGTGKLIKK
jgi:hypothetical protein